MPIPLHQPCCHYCFLFFFLALVLFCTGLGLLNIATHFHPSFSIQEYEYGTHSTTLKDLPETSTSFNFRRLHGFMEEGHGSWRRAVLEGRRRLSGPGSAPPSCASKCGNCFPCRPIRIPIEPGNSVGLTEYYPEAWRCRCGNKLYMP